MVKACIGKTTDKMPHGAEEEFSYALVENIGSVEFQIRIESIHNELNIPIQASGLVVIKLKKDDVLYFDALNK